ncbi:MAG: rhodanese-like domain-containing protein [Phycisphaerales bacterium]
MNSSASQTVDPARELTVQAAAALLADEAARVALIDCRTPAEAALASIAGSRLIPLHNLPMRMDEIRTIEPDVDHVIVYCHHGRRSLIAVDAMRIAGMSKVMSMAGGIDAWSRVIDATVPRY